MKNPGQNSAPIAIAGSEISVASTQSNVEAGENQNSFARLMTSTGAVNSARLLPMCSGGLKNLPATMAAARRMSTCGPPLCVIISPLWEVMMHSRLLMR